MTPRSSIDRLSRLEAGDRVWILGQLSAREKAALMDKVCADTPAGNPARHTPITITAPPPVGDSAMERLRHATSGAVARALRAEPAWLIAAVLSIDVWPWRSEFLQQLPAGLRSEIAQSLGNAKRPTDAVCDALVRLAIGRIEGERRPPRRSLVRSLLHRLEVVLVNKRLTLRS
jgi:hypothetical protein